MKHTSSLNQNRAIRRVYSRGVSLANRLLALHVLPNATPGNRLGVTVSRKVGKAVTRNRVRRLVKEQYRLAETAIAVGYDLVVVARPAAGQLARPQSFEEIGRALKLLLKKHGLLLPP